MEVIRQEAQRQKRCGIREVRLFSDFFIKSVYFFGRSHEVLLTALFNIFSLHFTQDVLSAPEMYLKGKIHLLPHRVKNRKAVRHLINNYKKSLKKGESS
jgi:hypothetical protein